MKIKITILFFFLVSAAQSQSFNSSEQIRMFADYLFCEKDFLRAAEEYQKLLNNNYNDSLLFKQGLSFSAIGDYNAALDKFSAVNKTSGYYINSREETAKINFITENFNADNGVETEPIKKLEAAAKLLNEENISSAENLSAPFKDAEKRNFLELINKKREIKHKSPVFAGILSFIVPGLGKIYTGNISDGITSFIATSLFYFLAYDNFRAEHRERAWLFTGLGILFNAGNIYGSAAEAQIYNEREKQNFTNEVNDFVKSENYFIQRYDFCK